MTNVWVVRNRHGDIVQTYHEEPYEQPDGWTTTRETLLTPEMAAVIEAAKAFFDLPRFHTSGAVFNAVAALRALEGDA
jgi:hypothetical protein